MAYVYISYENVWYFSVRKWRHKSTLGAHGQWEVEVGEPLAGPVNSSDSEVIKENCSNVGFHLWSLWLYNLSWNTSFSNGHFCLFKLTLIPFTKKMSKCHAFYNGFECFRYHSLCSCVKTQRPAFSGESATFPTPKMSSVFL